jgi:hypothetical protein
MLSTVTHLFSPQGVIQIGKRNATTGVVGTFMDLGDAPKLSVSLKTEVEEINESTSGNRLPMARLEKSKSAEISMDLRSFDKKTLSLLLRSVTAAVSGSSVVAEVMATGLVAGDIVRLAHPFVSSVVVKDSTGSPITLDVSDYTVDADGGLIRIVDPSGYVQPFKVDYTYAAQEVSAMFTGAQDGYTLIFSGVNTAVSNAPVFVELYNVVFDPADNIDFIADSANPFTLKGSLLIDSFKSAADTTLGQFGRVIRKT